MVYVISNIIKFHCWDYMYLYLDFEPFLIKNYVLHFFGLYFYGMDKSLKKYIEELDPKRVHKIVPFSTSWKSKHTIELIREMAKAKGIETTEEYIYATNTPDEDELKEARRLTDIIINNY